MNAYLTFLHVLLMVVATIQWAVTLALATLAILEMEHIALVGLNIFSHVTYFTYTRYWWSAI